VPSAARSDLAWPPSLDALTPFLRALGSVDASALGAWIVTEQPGTAWVAWLDAQGLAPYVFHTLQALHLPSRLPGDVEDALRAAYYQGAGANAVQRQELSSALRALASAGVEGVLLKGAALACTAYPDPLCRPMGDIDFWVQPARLPAAIIALEAIGYRAGTRDDRPPALAALIGGEQQMLGRKPGAGLIELQWPAWRGEWYRHTALTDYAGIWERCRPATIEGQPARVMAPEDALVHLCLHEAVNHQFSAPWLRSLLDVHLAAQVQGLDWTILATRARSWRLATPVWAMLSLARAFFATPVPEATLSALAPGKMHRRAIASLHLNEDMIAMRSGGYGYRRFLIQLLMAERLRDAARLSWRALFPDRAWLEARYGVSTPGALARVRLAHPLRLLLSARA